MTAKKASKDAVLMRGLRAAAKRRSNGGFAGILFAIVHLFLELLGLLFVHKAQSGEAFFEFKSMEKRPVLVITPCVEDLLIPNDSSGGGLL